MRTLLAISLVAMVRVTWFLPMGMSAAKFREFLFPETWPTVGQMQRGIAATLRAYGGGPTKIRLGASTANGYLRSAVAIVASL